MPDLPNITIKGLRHTHATLLLQAGVNPKVVQERLGHSNIATTMDIYSHVTPTIQAEAFEKYEKWMTSACN
jgi:integrase